MGRARRWGAAALIGGTALSGGLAVASAGAGQAPVRASVTTLAFGARPDGAPVTRTIRFTNVTDDAMELGYVSLLGPTPAAFDIASSTCIAAPTAGEPPDEGTVLAPGESCTWDVTFRPARVDGTRSYAAVFDYVAGRPPAIDTGAHYTIRLTGRLRP